MACALPQERGDGPKAVSGKAFVHGLVQRHLPISAQLTLILFQSTVLQTSLRWRQYVERSHVSVGGAAPNDNDQGNRPGPCVPAVREFAGKNG